MYIATMKKRSVLCQMSEYGHYTDPDWVAKYINMGVPCCSTVRAYADRWPALRSAEGGPQDRSHQKHQNSGEGKGQDGFDIDKYLRHELKLRGNEVYRVIEVEI